MSNRRTFLQMLSSLPILNGLAGLAQAAPTKRDFLKELGVRPIINGAGVYTMMTGSLMNPEAVRAIEAMSHHFVRLDEPHDAVGQRIAKLLECEAAMVPSGAAAGLTLATAACMTGTNAEFILRLPDATGMKNEVIIHKSHRSFLTIIRSGTAECNWLKSPPPASWRAPLLLAPPCCCS